MKKENKGFTLIETVLSIALMGVVIVTVLGVFVKGSQALKKGRYRLIGVNIAQRKMTQVEYLLSKFPNYNDEAYGADIDNAISCTTSRPAGPVVFFKNPPSAMAGITIEGIEYFQGTEECNFTITIDDYDDGGTTIYDIKKVVISVTWIDPASGEEKKYEIAKLIAKI